MGDILVDLASRMLRLMGLWGCGDRGSDIHQIHTVCWPRGADAGRAGAAGEDVAELDIGIAHQPVAAFGFADANRFADQRLADKDQLTGPFDLAVAAHPADRDIMRLAVPQRRMRALPQPRGALTAISPEPFVAGLAADPVL